LTGLGELAQLQSPSVDLETHIADIVAHIDNEELKDIVLVGHSWWLRDPRGVGPTRSADFAYRLLDAFVPLAGETVASYAPPERAQGDW
jgi:hypothetical protein